jgi:hypothetical protein
MRIGLLAAAGLMAVTLTGCEEFSFDTRTPQEQAFIDLQDETLAIRSELDTLDPTSYANLPVSGQATYDGTAVVALDTSVPTELIGVASVTANFATDRITGNMTGFVGAIDGGEVVDYDGNLTISNGIIAVRSSDYVDVRVDGALVAGDDVLDVNAELNGNFYGTTGGGALPPPGLDMSATEDSVFTLNGAEVGGGMQVSALTD